MADNSNEAAKQQEEKKHPMNILFSDKSEGYQKTGLQRFIAAMKELRSDRSKTGFKDKYGDIYKGPWFALFDAGKTDSAKPYAFARTAAEVVQKELDYDIPSPDVIFYDHETNTVNFSPTYLNTKPEAYDSHGIIKQSVLDEARREISELVPPAIEKRMPKETVPDRQIESLVDKLKKYASEEPWNSTLKYVYSSGEKDNPFNLIVINDNISTYSFFPTPNRPAENAYGAQSVRISSNEERGDAVYDNHIVSDKMWSELVAASANAVKAVKDTDLELVKNLSKLTGNDNTVKVKISSGRPLLDGTYSITKFNPKHMNPSDEFYNLVKDAAAKDGNPNKDVFLVKRESLTSSAVSLDSYDYVRKRGLLEGTRRLLAAQKRNQGHSEYLSEGDRNRFPETYYVLQKSLDNHNIDTETYLNPLSYLHKTAADDHIDLSQTWTKANVVLGALDSFDEEDKTYAITDDGATQKAYRKYPRWQIEEKIRNSNPAKVKFSADVKKLADAMGKSQKKEEGKTYYAFIGREESEDFPDKETLLNKEKLAKYTYGELDYTESLEDWDTGSLVERFKDQQKVVYKDDNIVITANAYNGAENPDLLNTTLDVWRVVPEKEALRRMSLDDARGDADFAEWTPTALALWNNHYSEISKDFKTDTNIDNMEKEDKKQEEGYFYAALDYTGNTTLVGDALNSRSSISAYIQENEESNNFCNWLEAHEINEERPEGKVLYEDSKYIVVPASPDDNDEKAAVIFEKVPVKQALEDFANNYDWDQDEFPYEWSADAEDLFDKNEDAIHELLEEKGQEIPDELAGKLGPDFHWKAPDNIYGTGNMPLISYGNPDTDEEVYNQAVTAIDTDKDSRMTLTISDIELVNEPNKLLPGETIVTAGNAFVNPHKEQPDYVKARDWLAVKSFIENKILASRQEKEESLKPSENPYIKAHQSREKDLEMLRNTPVNRLYILQNKYEQQYNHWSKVAPKDSDYGSGKDNKETLRQMAEFNKEMLDRVNTVIEERKNGLDGNISHPTLPRQGGEWHNSEQEQQRAYAFYGQMLGFFSEQRTDYPMVIDPSHYVQSDNPVNSLMMTVYAEMKKLKEPAFFTDEDIRRFNLKIDPFMPYLPLIEGTGAGTKVTYVYPAEYTDIEQHDRVDEPELFERYDAVRAAVENGKKQMVANRQSLESFIANPQWRIPIVSDEDPKAKAVLSYTGNSVRYDDSSKVIYVRQKENDNNDPSVRTMNIADALADSILERSNGFIKHETYANYNYYNATHLMNAIRYGVNLGVSDKGRRIEGFGPMDSEDKLYHDPRYVKEILTKSGIAAKAISNRIEGLGDGLMNTKGITPSEYKDYLNNDIAAGHEKNDNSRNEDRGSGIKL